MALTKINRPDSEKALFGTGSDLEIYHNGTNSNIDNHTGILSIRGGGGDIVLQPLDGETAVYTVPNAQVQLRYDDSTKFETLSDGAKFYGHLYTNDANRIKLGNGNDLEIYHDGSDSWIRDKGTGRLLIDGSEIHIRKYGTSETMAKFIEDAAVELYHNDQKKFETTDVGVQATGHIFSTTKFRGNDDVKVSLGTSEDLQLYHDGTNSHIVNTTADLNLQSNSLYLKNQDGDHVYVKCVDDAQVELNYNGNKKFETTNSGAEVTGSLGIGVNVPARELHVHSGDSGSTYIALTNSTTGATSSDGFSIGLSGSEEGKLWNNENTAIIFGTNSIQRMTLSNLGKLGIGTDNPDTLLHLAGADTAVIRLENTDTSLSADQVIGGLEFEKQDGSGAGAGVVGGLRMYSGVDGITTYLTLSTSNSSNNNVEALRITSDRNVQIDNDSGKFQVGDGQDLSIYHDGSHSYIKENGTGNLYIDSNQLYIRNQDTSNVLIQTTSAGVVQLKHNGTTKFSTTTDGLDVAGTIHSEHSSGNVGYTMHATGNSLGAQVRFRNDHADDCYVGLSGDTNGHLLLYPGGSGKTKIYSGTSQKLETNGDGIVVTGLITAGDIVENLINETALSASVSGNTACFQARGAAAHCPIMTWNNHGSGTRTQLQFGDGASYTARGSITTAGTSGTSYNTTSDYRLKQDDVLITDGITIVKALKPKRFKWKDDSALGVCDGFFAHEVQEATSTSKAVIGTKDAVDDDGKPIYQQIDHSKLIPLLTAALKEAITKIETLETKVAALESA